MNDSEHFYVTLLSNSSHGLYPNNTHARYMNFLGRAVYFSSDQIWEFGLCKISCPATEDRDSKPGHLLVFTNIIEPQRVGGQLVRCLRTLPYSVKARPETFDNVYYVPFEKLFLQSIIVAIKASEGDKVGFIVSEVHSKIVLHFRRVSG